MAKVDALNEILDLCKKFVSREAGNTVLDADLESDTGWVKTIWTKSAQIGLPGLMIPEEFSGVEQPALCGALVIDTLASQCAGLASVFAYHFAGCLLLGRAGQVQKEKVLVPLANIDTEETAIATVIFPSFQDSSALRLEEEEEGKLKLSGTSPAAGNMEYATHILVFVEEEQNAEQVTCLLVEKGVPGMTAGPSLGLPGLKVNPFCPVDFENLKVTEEAIVGGRGQGGPMMKEAQNFFYSCLAAAAMGAARTAYMKAYAYARERYQYGKMIIDHQEIQRMLGAMLLKLNIGTAAYMRVFEKDTLRLPCSSPDAALAKAYCTDASLEIAIDAIQVHGGYGYMHEYGVEKIMRDCKVLQLIGRSTPNLLIEAIAREREVHD